ncbi:MAG: hypothetical protein AAF438_08000, partial [Pseudomonadota bacterium]
MLKQNRAGHWDVLNINNAYVRDFLLPAGCIQNLQNEALHQHVETLPNFAQRFVDWTQVNGNYFGVLQRFGPFNLVVNTNAIDLNSARDQGFALADDSAFHGRYAILLYEDFNLFHVCMASGVNPFLPLSSEELALVGAKIQQWIKHAACLSVDHHELNKKLVEGEIDFYLSGGIYTASPARRAGHKEIVAVTPVRGPIGGRGGIAFAEVSSILARSENPLIAEKMLEHILSSEIAVRIAQNCNTSN